jgi:hypothetical protein
MKSSYIRHHGPSSLPRQDSIRMCPHHQHPPRLSNTSARDDLPSSPRSPLHSRRNTSSSNRRNLRFPHDTTKPPRTTTYSSTMSGVTQQIHAAMTTRRSSEVLKTMCLRQSVYSRSGALQLKGCLVRTKNSRDFSKVKIRSELQFI